MPDEESVPPASGGAPAPAPEQEQEREVRRLLALARHREPLPAEVAARLDETLASLAAERDAAASASGDRSQQVVPLRRRWPAALLAAAAVAAIGYGTTQLVTGGLETTTLDAGSSSGDAARPGPAAEREPLDPGAEDDRVDVTSEDEVTDRSGDGAGEGPRRDTEVSEQLAALRSAARSERADRLGRTLHDLATERLVVVGEIELAGPGPTTPGPTSGAAESPEAPAYGGPPALDCGPRLPGAVTALAARYDGHPALVTVGSGWAGFRPVEVYVCDGLRPHRPAQSLLLVESRRVVR